MEYRCYYYHDLKDNSARFNMIMRCIEFSRMWMSVVIITLLTLLLSCSNNNTTMPQHETFKINEKADTVHSKIVSSTNISLVSKKKIYSKAIRTNETQEEVKSIPVLQKTEQTKYTDRTPPTYPGGEQALEYFLFQNNLYNTSKYPESIGGNVYLNLIIDSAGFVVDKRILRRVGIGIDDEALRLAQLLKFSPAKDSLGNAVQSVFILKVNFRKYEREISITDVAIHIPCEPGFTYSKRTKMKICDAIFIKKPAFPHGKSAMRKYFNSSILYPVGKIVQGIEGTVKIQVAISSDGQINEIRIYKSLDERLDEIAVSLLCRVERWKPAICKKKPVDGFMNLKIKFRLPKDINTLLEDKRYTY